ncbi:MAG: hypothetical protein GJ676_03830 [Rhodobacteraceae bacterium]|nr:hypothetical protein [Paracoccaceae bacterium]
MESKVYAVDHLRLTFQKASPANLLVEAEGRAASSGWQNARLIPHHYSSPPADGVLGLDFLAQSPSAGSIVLPVLTHVHCHTVLSIEDPINFWGDGLDLKGVRCEGVANTKISLFDPQHGKCDLVVAADPLTGAVIPSFQRDIRPLFRDKDIKAMLAVRNLNLASHTEVRRHAKLIFERLEDGSMPCDGGWPQADLELFRAWIKAGTPP